MFKTSSEAGKEKGSGNSKFEIRNKFEIQKSAGRRVIRGFFNQPKAILQCSSLSMNRRTKMPLLRSLEEGRGVSIATKMALLRSFSNWFMVTMRVEKRPRCQ